MPSLNFEINGVRVNAKSDNIEAIQTFLTSVLGWDLCPNTIEENDNRIKDKYIQEGLVPAVKYRRDLTGERLMDAKRYVEALCRDLIEISRLRKDNENLERINEELNLALGKKGL